MWCTTVFVGLGIGPPVFLGKDSLPAPVFRRIGIFSVECVWQQDATPPVGHILLVNGFGLLEVVMEGHWSLREAS